MRGNHIRAGEAPSSFPEPPGEEAEAPASPRCPGLRWSRSCMNNHGTLLARGKRQGVLGSKRQSAAA